jgi:adenylate cyclase
MINKTVSHYKIIEEVGRGGMGIVYKAQDTKLERQVAIKFLPPQIAQSESDKLRFLQEAKAAAALNHPNILHVHEINEHEGTLFLVMEFIEGKTLKSIIADQRSGKGFGIEKAVQWVSQTADGLKAAHGKGIIHRDIKPENMMLTGDNRVKIMDFGLAKLKSGSGLTKAGTSLGTLSYMSPEQAQGGTVDQRSDIWSLGVVFYELLTGELPFKAEHDAALMYLIINEEPHVPSTLDRKIPHAVDMLVMKMLSKDLNSRYQIMDEVIDALRALKSELENAEKGAKTKAIAVLPFENISAEKENDYFGDGLTEELIANLSRLKDIGVVSRTTSMQYKGTKKDIKTIGKELGAQYILEGSVRKYQDNLRITVQLIDVVNDRQLWAETYKGKLADVFDIQEQVSQQIVDALMVKLTPTEKIVLTKRPTVNAEAFDLCLRARDYLYRFNKSNLKMAIQLFQKAIELDARYASAYAGLGESYATLYQLFERNDSWLDRSIESCLKALMYDSSLSEAYAALSLSYFNKQSLDEALDASKKAIELDPNNFLGYWILARIYHLTDQDAEALEMLEKVISLNPDFYSAYGDLRLIYERLGDIEKLNSSLQRSLEVYPRYLARHPDDARAHMFFAIDLAQSNKNEMAKIEAETALELNPSDPLMLYNAACFYARLGEKKLAVEALRNSVAAGHEDFEWFKRDTDLDGIRDEPGYLELMDGK